MEEGRLGTTSGIVLNSWTSTLIIDNSRATNSPDRLANSIPVSMRGGRIEFLGGDGASAETLGPVTLAAGSATIQTVPSWEPGPHLNSNPARGPGTTLSLLGQGIRLGTPPLLDDGIVGGWIPRGL